MTGTIGKFRSCFFYFATAMKAIVIREHEDGTFSRAIEQREVSSLPDNDVLIRVVYAGLNYKDALSAHGHKGITRKYPHTPGVDAAGVVEHDRTGTYSPGDKVICTSYDLGMNTSGGFAEYIKVPVSWVVPLPSSISLEESMVLGTAAYTAGLALHKMEQCGQTPEMGEVVVTGASGGVGSMAVALLAKAGYSVVASSGKQASWDWLREIGASKCIGREEVSDTSGRPLLRSMWAGAIDNVGGNTLSTLIRGCAKEGCVASIGLVESPKFDISVYPFILNGVNLLGVDSAETPAHLRNIIWNKLANEWKLTGLHHMKTIVSLEEIIPAMESMMRGETKGRIVAHIQN